MESIVTTPSKPDEIVIEDEKHDEAQAEVWQEYVCRSLSFGKRHPGDIVEAATLASVPLPQNQYDIQTSLAAQIESGVLSDLQLEAVAFAGERHLKFLPNNSRCGFFIGDSAGVGKGRQIAAIMVDNMVRGRRRHIWFSSSADLVEDARRDFSDLGTYVTVLDGCKAIDKATKGLGIAKTSSSQVLFSTYAGLVSSGSVKSRGSRFQQLVNWCGGESFDGCIVFDECHKAKNNKPDDPTGKNSSKVAQYVLEIQRVLPAARVVYASATGFSEVANMAFLDRMGIWGPGCPFPSFQKFCKTMERRSMGALELLAMEFKSMGSCVMRQLGFHKAEFAVVESGMTVDDIRLYDACCELWQAIHDTIQLMDSPGRLWITYWAAHQRFFKQLCMSIKVPRVIEESKSALARGECVVIGLQTTGEAALNSGLAQYELKRASSQPRNLGKERISINNALRGKASDVSEAFNGEFVSICKGVVTQFLRTQIISETAVHRPKNNEIIKMFERLLEVAENMALPPSALDTLIDQLGGPSCVAEMTGRSRRVVRDANGELLCESRVAESSSADASSINRKENNAFMNGDKLVAIISDAASTGISLHALEKCNNTRRRNHLTLELPWSSEAAVQQLGRTHRTFQASAPFYKLITSGVGGENRFVSCISARLQQLGALTRGDRRANASGLSLSEFDFSNRYGRTALVQVYESVISQNVFPGVNWYTVVSDVQDRIDLAIEASDGKPVGNSLVPEPILTAGKFLEHITVAIKIVADVGEASTLALTDANKRNVHKFLNRLLGLPIHLQSLLFRYFSAVLETLITQAMDDGTYDSGVSELVGTKITKVLDRVVYTDPSSKAKARLVELNVDRGISFDDALCQLEAARIAFGESPELAKDTNRITKEIGTFYLRQLKYQQIVMLGIRKTNNSHLLFVSRPNTGRNRAEKVVAEIERAYVPIAATKAKEIWENAYTRSSTHCSHAAGFHKDRASRETCTYGTRFFTVSIIAGIVTPIWPTLQSVLHAAQSRGFAKAASLRIARATALSQSGEETRVVGVSWPSELHKELDQAVQVHLEEARLKELQQPINMTFDIVLEVSKYKHLMPLKLDGCRSTSSGLVIENIASSNSFFRDLHALNELRNGDTVTQILGLSCESIPHYLVEQVLNRMVLVEPRITFTMKRTTMGKPKVRSELKCEVPSPVLVKAKHALLNKPKTLHSFFGRGAAATNPTPKNPKKRMTSTPTKHCSQDMTPPNTATPKKNETITPPCKVMKHDVIVID